MKRRRRTPTRRVIIAGLGVTCAAVLSCDSGRQARLPNALAASATTSSSAAPTGSTAATTKLDPATIPLDYAALPTFTQLWRKRETTHPSLGRLIGWSTAASLVLFGHDSERRWTALDLRSGAKRWAVTVPHEPDDGETYDSVIDDDEGLIFGEAANTVFALELDSGAERWRKKLSGVSELQIDAAEGGWLLVNVVLAASKPPAQPPTASPTTAADATRTIVALRASSGRRGWTAPTSPHSGSTRVSAGYVFQEDCGEVTARRLDDGVQVGSRKFDRCVSRSLVHEDWLVVSVPRSEGNDAYHLLGLRAPQLETVWQLDVAKDHHVEDLELAGGALIVQVAERLRRVELKTGRVLSDVDLRPFAHRPDYRAKGSNAKAPARYLGPSCIDDLELAADLLVAHMNRSCPPRGMLLLDPVTLEPRAKVSPPVAAWEWARGTFEPAGDIGLLSTEDGEVALDLRRLGPPLRQLIPDAKRIERIASRMEQGIIPPSAFAYREEVSQFALGGKALVPTLNAVLRGKRLAARVFAADVAQLVGATELVAPLMAIVTDPGIAPSPPTGLPGWASPGPFPECYECTEAYLAKRAAAALAATPDPRATGALAGVMQDPRRSNDEQVTAMTGLARIGTPSAIQHIDALRATRSKRRGPWQPKLAPLPASPSGLQPQQGAASNDGSVVAQVDVALGGARDVWLLGQGKPLFSGITASGELKVLSAGTSPAFSTLVVRRSGERAPAGVKAQERLRLKWSSLRRDQDGDGWTDRVEQRLHTSPTSADTDGDAIADPFDVAPRAGPTGLAAGCSPAEALRAAFFANSMTLDQQLPLYVAGDPVLNLPYDGYGAPVIFVTTDEAAALRKEIGPNGATFLRFSPQSSDSARSVIASYVRLSKDGQDAKVSLWEYRGPEAGVWRDIELRCVKGRWYAVDLVVRAVS